MIFLVLTCLLSGILAHRYDGFYDRNFHQRSINEHFFDTNFSEDEINAINEYKKGRNFRAYTRNNVFNPHNRRFFGWIKNILQTEPKPVKYEDLVKNKLFYLHLTRDLTDNISELTKILYKFTNALKEHSIINATLRKTRSVNESDFLEGKKADNATTVGVTTDNIIPKDTNGRRVNSWNVKQKILSSINDTLNIVLHKFESASNAQKVFGDNLLFNIGFLSGSTITLKGFVEELLTISSKSDLLKDADYIFQLYHTVNKVHDISSKVLDQLNLFVDEATKEVLKNERLRSYYDDV